MSTTISRIASRHNPRFREWLRWVNEPERLDVPWVPVEGPKVVWELSERRPLELLLLEEESDQIELSARARRCFQLSRPLMDRLSAVRSPQGLIGFFEKPVWDWAELGEFVLFLDGLQDPGNLGTLMRTAAATGLFRLVTGPTTVSRFNSKVVRAAAGSLFSVPCLDDRQAEELSERGFSLWVASAGEGESLFKAAFEPPLAVVLGSEGKGPGLGLRDLPHQVVQVPMAEGIESLNVSVAGSLIMYEVVRRRHGE